jgi:hypothetical protein
MTRWGIGWRAVVRGACSHLDRAPHAADRLGSQTRHKPTRPRGTARPGPPHNDNSPAIADSEAGQHSARRGLCIYPPGTATLAYSSPPLSPVQHSTVHLFLFSLSFCNLRSCFITCNRPATRRSNPEAVARNLARALLRSSSVAVSAAGPAAALVALQAAAKARRAIGAREQLDLAFGMDYRRVSPGGDPPLGCD